MHIVLSSFFFSFLLFFSVCPVTDRNLTPRHLSGAFVRSHNGRDNDEKDYFTLTYFYLMCFFYITLNNRTCVVTELLLICYLHLFFFFFLESKQLSNIYFVSVRNT